MSPSPPRLRTALLAGALILAAGAARAATVLTFAWTPNPQTPQVDVAIDRKLFEKAGLDVKLVTFPSGREAFEALLGGQVDLAFATEFPAATGAMRGQSFGVVADLTRYRGSRLVASSAAMPLASAADLAGRRIGVPLGTNMDYFTSLVLADAKVKAEVINAAPSDLLPALVRGDVAAAAPFPTFYAAIRGALGPKYEELRSDRYVVHNLVMASGAALSGKGEALRAFLGALVEADAAVAGDPAAAQAMVAAHMQSAMGQGAAARDAVADTFRDLDAHVELKRGLLDLMVDEAGWLVERKLVKAKPPTAATLRPILADAPLRAVSPGSVDLP